MLAQVLIDGLTVGLIYAVVAIGYTLVYGVLEFINFAHGDVFMVGAFVGSELLLAFQGAGWVGKAPGWILLSVAMLGGLIIAAVLGVVIERVAYRPLRNAPRLIPLISAVGVSFLLEDVVRMGMGVWQNTFYLSVPTLFQGFIHLGDVTIPVTTVVIMFAALIMMFGLEFFVNRTRLGIAMRAVALDQTASSLMGISVNGIIALTFLIGSGLGGATGVLYAQQYGTIDPYIGYILGLKAFTAAVLGGIGNIRGTMIGGVLLGIAETAITAYMGIWSGGTFGSQFKDVYAFILLIVILIFRPNGLFGTRVAEKV